AFALGLRGEPAKRVQWKPDAQADRVLHDAEQLLGVAFEVTPCGFDHRLLVWHGVAVYTPRARLNGHVPALRHSARPRSRHAPRAPTARRASDRGRPRKEPRE